MGSYHQSGTFFEGDVALYDKVYCQSFPVNFFNVRLSHKNLNPLARFLLLP